MPGRKFVDVPGNGVAFILMFGDDIVFAENTPTTGSCFCICRRQIIYFTPAARPYTPGALLGLAG